MQKHSKSVKVQLWHIHNMWWRCTAPKQAIVAMRLVYTVITLNNKFYGRVLLSIIIPS
jgi:hypothetical protein